MQEVPGANCVLQPSPIAKFPTVELNAVSRSVSVVLMLVTVTVCWALVLWTGTLPKLSEAGESERAGGSGIPVPVTEKVCFG